MMTPYVVLYRAEGADRFSAQAVAASNSETAISGLRSFFEAEKMTCAIIGALTEADLNGMLSLVEDVKNKIKDQQNQNKEPVSETTTF